MMNPGDRELLADFERCRAVTADLLGRVPDAMLRKTPRGEDATLGKLFHHIAATVDGWMLNCMQDGGPPPDWQPKVTPGRREIEASLEASRKRLVKFFRARGGAMMGKAFERSRDGKNYRFTGRNRVAYLTAHEGHHRGKIVLALRQWGFADIPFMPFRNDPV